MKTIPIALFVVGALILAVSIGQRVFGAYGYIAQTEDAIGVLILAALGYYIWGKKEQ